MTYKEAHRIIMADADFDFSKISPKSQQTADALCVAVKALKKQMPKKPNVYDDRFVHCPNCDEALGYKWEKYPTEKTDFKWLKHCWNCGQCIDWE